MQTMSIEWMKIDEMEKEIFHNFPNGKTRKTLIIFIYGKSRFIQFYLNDKKTAVARFNKAMNNRSGFEINNEGWEAVGLEIFFDNNQAWLGNAGNQLNDLINILMNNLKE